MERLNKIYIAKLLTIIMLSTVILSMSSLVFAEKASNKPIKEKLSTAEGGFVDILDINYWIRKFENGPGKIQGSKWGNIASAMDESDLPGIKVPVLMYHEISLDEPGRFAVTPDKFRDDILHMKKAGYTPIFFDQLYDYLKFGKAIPEKPILITFDDGYVSNYDYAYPIAKDLDIKITIAVIGWSVGRETFVESSKAITPHFSYEAAKEMQDSGHVDIQSHTFDLHTTKGASYGYGLSCNLGMLRLEGESDSAYKKRVMEDLMRLNIEIHQGIGQIPGFVFYPYGVFGKDTEEVIEALGFKGTITIRPGVRKYQSVDDMRAMPRINIPNSLVGEELIKRIEDLPLIQEVFYNDKNQY